MSDVEHTTNLADPSKGKQSMQDRIAHSWTIHTNVSFDDAPEPLGNPRLPPAQQEEKLNLGDTLYLAQGLVEDGHYEEALKLYQAAEQAGVGYQATNGAGVCFNELEKPVEALACFDRAYAELRNEMVALASNRAKALVEAGRVREGIQTYDGLIQSVPGAAGALFRANRAMAYMQIGMYAECICECDFLLCIDPTNDKVRFTRGFAYLVLGDYERGFADYESRLKDQLNEPDAPVWTGEQDISGKTVLVHGEMGLGDNIMFMRYVPMMVARGAKVLVVVPASQKFMVHAIEGAEWVDVKNVPAIKLDYWVRFMSLAWCFRTTAEIVPPPAPLRLKERQNDPREFMKRVGICWAGSPKSRYDQHRTIKLEQLAPLFDVPGVIYYSLNKELRDGDQKAFQELSINPLRMDTFEDTANIMNNLDLVITVDTSVAHMAGTVGVPTMVMLTSFRTYWLWIQKLTTSPWYPSIEVVRQQTDGDWSNVIAHAVERVQQLVKKAA